MRFVSIAEFPSRFEAEVAAQDLEGAGIPYIIKSDDAAVFGGGFSALTGAVLQVPELMAVQAAEILAHDQGE